MARSKFSDDIFFGDDEIEKTFDFGGEANAPSEKEMEIVKTIAGSEIELDVDKLVPYKKHTYLVKDNEDMDALVESIRDYGIFMPILVRKIGSGMYEVIAGHRRLHAAKKAGLKKVPCKVVELDDNMADIQMVDTNLHRSDKNISPSEKARSYRLRKDAAIKQGKAEAKAPNAVELISEQTGENKRSVERYIRLTYLNEYLLNAVDEGKIPILAGVSLSFLSMQHQSLIVDVMKKRVDIKGISKKQAETLRTNEASRGLTAERIEEILTGEMVGRKSAKKKPFNEKMISDLLPEDVKTASLEDRVNYYRKALTEYSKIHK